MCFIKIILCVTILPFAHGDGSDQFDVMIVLSDWKMRMIIRLGALPFMSYLGVLSLKWRTKTWLNATKTGWSHDAPREKIYIKHIGEGYAIEDFRCQWL